MKLEPQGQPIGSRTTISNEDRDHLYLTARYVGRSTREYAINLMSHVLNVIRKDIMRRNAKWELYVTDVGNQGMWLKTARHLHQPI